MGPSEQDSFFSFSHFNLVRGSLLNSVPSCSKMCRDVTLAWAAGGVLFLFFESMATLKTSPKRLEPGAGPKMPVISRPVSKGPAQSTYNQETVLKKAPKNLDFQK